MKRFFCLLFIALITVILVSCAKAAPQTAEPTLPPIEAINPGDKIGDFLITTGEGEDVTYMWATDADCVKQEGAEIYSCQLPAGTKVNVSLGIYDDTLSGKLDSIWSEHTYEMFIEDRPVNLQAFGSIDVMHPRAGPMRHWNVVIVPAGAGEITVRSAGVAGGDSFEDTTTFIFSAP